VKFIAVYLNGLKNISTKFKNLFVKIISLTNVNINMFEQHYYINKKY